MKVVYRRDSIVVLSDCDNGIEAIVLLNKDAYHESAVEAAENLIGQYVAANPAWVHCREEQSGEVYYDMEACNFHPLSRRQAKKLKNTVNKQGVYPPMPKKKIDWDFIPFAITAGIALVSGALAVLFNVIAA